VLAWRTEGSKTDKAVIATLQESISLGQEEIRSLTDQCLGLLADKEKLEEDLSQRLVELDDLKTRCENSTLALDEVKYEWARDLRMCNEEWHQKVSAFEKNSHEKVCQPS
jgi:chromosome segregation ATPase